MSRLQTSSCSFSVCPHRSLASSMQLSCGGKVSSEIPPVWWSTQGQTHLCRSLLFWVLLVQSSSASPRLSFQGFRHTGKDSLVWASLWCLSSSWNWLSWDIWASFRSLPVLHVLWWPDSASRLTHWCPSASLSGSWCWTSYQELMLVSLWKVPFLFEMARCKCTWEGFRRWGRMQREHHLEFWFLFGSHCALSSYW